LYAISKLAWGKKKGQRGWIERPINQTVELNIDGASCSIEFTRTGLENAADTNFISTASVFNKLICINVPCITTVKVRHESLISNAIIESASCMQLPTVHRMGRNTSGWASGSLWDMRMPKTWPRQPKQQKKEGTT
jgi:hypothetical protein